MATSSDTDSADAISAYHSELQASLRDRLVAPPPPGAPHRSCILSFLTGTPAAAAPRSGRYTRRRCRRRRRRPEKLFTWPASGIGRCLRDLGQRQGNPGPLSNRIYEGERPASSGARRGPERVAWGPPGRHARDPGLARRRFRAAGPTLARQKGTTDDAPCPRGSTCGSPSADLLPLGASLSPPRHRPTTALPPPMRTRPRRGAAAGDRCSDVISELPIELT